MRSLLSIWARDVRPSKSPLVFSIPVRSSILIKSNVGGRIASGSSATLPRGAMNQVKMGDALLSVDVGSHNVISISAGAAQTCAILEAGQLKCWGNTADAQLGLGDNTTRGIAPGHMGDNLPVIDFGTGRSVMDVASLFSCTCALLDNGEVICWGAGTYPLGLGVPANMTGVGDNPGEMGDALHAMNLAATPSGSANETKAAAG